MQPIKPGLLATPIGVYLGSDWVYCAAGKKVHTMKPGLLASLLRDTNLIAQRVARLKELLPHINVSAMASKLPAILLQVTDLL